MEWIPNQPVYFGGEDTCNADEVEFVQIIDNTDKTQVQFKIDACQFAPNINDYPQFESAVFSNWTNGGACGNESLGTAYFTKSFGAGYYKFVIDVASIDCVLNVNFDLTNIGTITTTGVHTFYAYCTPIDGQFSLYVSGQGSVCLNQFDAFEVLTNAIVAIYDADGNWIDDVRYDSNPDYFSFVDDTMTITIDWAEREISNGCYRLCFLDPCENTNGQNYMANIRDGEFAEDYTNNWTSAGGVYQSGNQIVFYNGSITQTNVFNSYTSSITTQINIISLDGTMNVYYGPYGLSTPVATFTTGDIGIQNITGIPFGSFDLVIYVFGDAVIDYVGGVNVIPDNYVCDLTSPLMRLGDYTNDCTLLINACNNENGLGFNFSNSGFTPRLRLPAKLKNATYLNERSVYEDSAGKKSTYYFKRRKRKVLAIDLQPEYIHDFLSLAIGFDNFFINGQPYFVEDSEYNITYPDVYDNVGAVRLVVSEKVQNVKNVFCSDSENVCTLPPNSLLQTNLNFRIVQTDGSKILING